MSALGTMMVRVGFFEAAGEGDRFEEPYLFMRVALTGSCRGSSLKIRPLLTRLFRLEPCRR